MIEKLHRAIAWLVSVLSEKDGSGSSSRVAMMLVIVSVSASLIFYTVAARKLPDGSVLAGLAGLVTAGASLYGANAWKNRPQTSDPVTPAADISTKGAGDDSAHPFTR